MNKKLYILLICFMSSIATIKSMEDEFNPETVLEMEKAIETSKNQTDYTIARDAYLRYMLNNERDPEFYPVHFDEYKKEHRNLQERLSHGLFPKLAQILQQRSEPVQVTRVQKRDIYIKNLKNATKSPINVQVIEIDRWTGKKIIYEFKNLPAGRELRSGVPSNPEGIKLPFKAAGYPTIKVSNGRSVIEVKPSLDRDINIMVKEKLGEGLYFDIQEI